MDGSFGWSTSSDVSSVVSQLSNNGNLYATLGEKIDVFVTYDTELSYVPNFKVRLVLMKIS